MFKAELVETVEYDFSIIFVVDVEASAFSAISVLEINLDILFLEAKLSSTYPDATVSL